MLFQVCISSCIFLIWVTFEISLHDLQFKKLDSSYTGPSVHHLSETSCYCSCLVKATFSHLLVEMSRPHIYTMFLFEQNSDSKI